MTTIYKLTARLRELLATMTPGDWSYFDCREIYRHRAEVDRAALSEIRNALSVLLDEIDRYRTALRVIAEDGAQVLLPGMDSWCNPPGDDECRDMAHQHSVSVSCRNVARWGLHGQSDFLGHECNGDSVRNPEKVAANLLGRK